jgi:tetratricopeptide (TPR) repeat protein
VIGLWLLAGGLATAATSDSGLLKESSPQLSIAVADAVYRAGLEARTDAERAREQFARAARMYDRIWASGVHNAVVARNRAQAHLLAGDLGRAIAAYHSGLRLAPHDRSLHDELTYARGRVAYPLESNLPRLARPRDRWSLLSWAPVHVYALGAALLYLAGWLTLARAWMKRRSSWWIAGGLLIAAAVGLFFAVDIEQRALFNTHSDSRPAVTIGAETPFRTGNSAEYPPRLEAPLPAGVEVHLLAERGGWAQIQLAGGPIGWVARADVITCDQQEK